MGLCINYLENGRSNRVEQIYSLNDCGAYSSTKLDQLVQFQFHIIGMSLSEPHTSVTMCALVCVSL